MSEQEAAAPIRSAADRKMAMIRVADIDVVSSRGRGTRQFKENVRSIAENGLYKPILVNEREFGKSGRYQLVCGEGRLRAHKELKKEMIKAEIIDVDLATAHIMTLGENMAKNPPKAIEYAYSLYEMHERGASIADLQRVTGYSQQYVRSYITLIKQGEERLIKGVENGAFTLDFAMRVAESPDGAMQELMIEAYDRKIITAKHVDLVRRILDGRVKHGKGLGDGSGKDSRATVREEYTVDDLKRDIQRITKERERYASAVEAKETRLFRLMDAVRKIRSDATLLDLLRKFQVDTLPKLDGSHGV